MLDETLLIKPRLKSPVKPGRVAGRAVSFGGAAMPLEAYEAGPRLAPGMKE